MPNRRSFLSAAAAGTALGVVPLAGAHVAEGGPVRIGLVGCGGRGTGAAAQALRAEPNAELVAVADLFEDKTTRCLKGLAVSDVADRVTVDPETTFHGLDGYQKVIALKPDVVLLATPTYYRPLQLEACVNAGIHTFFEKPVAVDAPGVRRVLATIAKAKETNVGLLGGLCWRYETHMQDMVDRIQNGAIGDIVTLDTTRHSGYERSLPRRDEWTETEWTLRNWYNVNWLSGDFFVEQFVHDLDMLCWAKGLYPKSCLATGGRISRVREIDGNIYDHFAATYEFADGSRMHATTRQQPGTAVKYQNLVFGSKGTANLMRYQITGENRFWNRKRATVMHQQEHDVFFAALRAGDTPNDVEYMAESTLCGILGREAAYTGEQITWEQMLSSTKQYGPDAVTSLDQPLEIGLVPIPGKTRFV